MRLKHRILWEWGAEAEFHRTDDGKTVAKWPLFLFWTSDELHEVALAPEVDLVLPRRFGEAWRDPLCMRVLWVLRPFHLPVRWWHRLGGRYMLWRLVYRIGCIEVDDFGSYTDGRWRWPFCTKRTKDYAVRATRIKERTEAAKLRRDHKVLLVEIAEEVRALRKEQECSDS